MLDAKNVALVTALVAVVPLASIVVQNFSTQALAVAETPPPVTFLKQPGYYRFMLSDLPITVISDGTANQNYDKVLNNTTPAELERLLNDSFLKSPTQQSINVFMIELGSKLVLIDTGGGSFLGPTAGKVPANLKGAGFEADKVTDILLTHAHADHFGGLLSGDKPSYPNATIHMDKHELDYWLSEENMKAAPEKLKNFQRAQQVFKPLVAAGKIQTFDGDTQLFDGLKAIAAPGHTPGHTMYELTSNGEKLLLWGDLTHAYAVQFAKPAVTTTYDSDASKAAQLREALLADAAAKRYWIASTHNPFPGIGHVRKAGQAYEWVPDNYRSFK